MDELRVVRREDQSLIVASETGEQFRLLVDASVLAELRQLARQNTGESRVKPREIQALVRAGKTRAEIAEITGTEESDIERYEGPVLAERAFILTSAQSVPVRKSPADLEEEKFGEVIGERLASLQAAKIEWNSWRDEEAGWMVGLNFESHAVAHNAIWSFDHRKNMLDPITPDAVSLSKQGEVGDRLIPKLRAVDDSEKRGRFDSGAFEPDQLPLDGAEPSIDGQPGDHDHDTRPQFSPAAEAALKAGHPSTGSIPVIDADAEFARRREIDQRAIKTPEPELPDLGQTADLLEALRRRRGEREETGSGAPEVESEEDRGSATAPAPRPGDEQRPTQQRVAPVTELHHEAQTDTPESSNTPHDEPQELPVPQQPNRQKPESNKRGKGRTSIPSWDDILFGTSQRDDD